MSRITRITITSGPVRKKPKEGDERFLKGRGVWQVRQQKKICGAYLVSNGRPVWEWVDKGSEQDRNRKQPPKQEAP